MSRINRLLIAVIAILIVSLPVFAQDQPEEELQLTEEEKQLLKEMEEMGLTGEDGGLDMEALQQMQEGMANMFQQMNVPSGPYENTDFNYSFVIPEGWSGVYVFGVLTIAKGDISDMMSEMDMSQPSMMIVAIPPEEIEDNIDIDTVDLSQVKAQMEAAEEEGIEITVVETKKTSVEGHTAIYVEMGQNITVPNENSTPYTFSLHSSVYMFDANGLRYNIMFASPSNLWDENKDFFNDQVKNFKLMD